MACLVVESNFSTSNNLVCFSCSAFLSWRASLILSILSYSSPNSFLKSNAGAVVFVAVSFSFVAVSFFSPISPKVILLPCFEDSSCFSSVVFPSLLSPLFPVLPSLVVVVVAFFSMGGGVSVFNSVLGLVVVVDCVKPPINPPLPSLFVMGSAIGVIVAPDKILFSIVVTFRLNPALL